MAKRQTLMAELNGATSPPAEDRVKTLEAELERTRKQLQQVREERCLEELQAVLEKHRCNLSALPNGAFQCQYVGG